MPDLNPLSFLELIGRLLLALLLGSVIGWERETAEKSAGLRTNILVSLGSAFFTLSMIQSGIAQVSVDALSRGIQGIITGVGFVGAGTIFQNNRAHGLTSAATVWMSSAVGIGVSLGQWEIGVVATILTLFTLRTLKYIEPIK